MIDLETWGTSPGSALRSIGAAEFELGGEIGSTFYMNIDRESCILAGLAVDPSTEEWWSKQSAESQAALLVDPKPLVEVVDEFHKWFRANGLIHVWCQGGNFDEPLWVAAAKSVDRTVPWKFWNVRCTRTAYHMCSFDQRSLIRDGVHHNALDDAIHQVRCVQLGFDKIYKRSQG